MRYLSVFLLLLLQVPAFAASVPYEMLGYTNVARAGVLGTADDTAVFQSVLNRGGAIMIPYGTYTVANLYPTNNTRIIGNGAVLRFKSGSTGALLDWRSNTNIHLETVIFEGGVTTANPTPIGDRTAVAANVNDFSGSITGCRFWGFSDCGLRLYGTNDIGWVTTNNSIIVSDNRAWRCFQGYNFASPNINNVGEYTTLNNCQGADCTYGVNIGAGNSRVLGGHYIGNTRGIFVFGGANPAHSDILDVDLNHNDFPIWVEGVDDDYGMMFWNCKILGGGTIMITNSGGIIIDGGYIDPAAVVVGKSAGNTTSGLNIIQNVKHVGPWITPTLSGGAQVIVNNTIQIDGGITNLQLTLFTNIPAGTVPFYPQLKDGSMLLSDSGSGWIRTNFQWAPLATGAPYSIAASNTVYIDYDINAMGLADGNVVSQLTDYSGNNYHGKTNSLNAPYWTNNASVLNNLGFVRFSGSSSGVSTNIAGTLSQPFTVYLVCRVPNNSGSALWAATGSQSFISSGSVFHFAGSQIGAAVSSNSWMIIEQIFDGASSTMKTNGVLAVSGNVGSGGLQGFNVGCAIGGTQNAAMDVARIIVINGKPAALTSTYNNAWLNSRYAVHLP